VSINSRVLEKPRPLVSLSGRGIGKKATPTLKVLQQLLDPALVSFALMIISKLYDQSFNTPYILLAAISFLLVLSVFRALDLYRIGNGTPSRPLIYQVLTGWGVVVALLLSLGFVTKTTEDFSRLIFTTWVVAVPPLLFMAHTAVHYLVGSARASGKFARTAVIVGGSQVGHHLAEKIRRSPELGLRLQSCFNLKGSRHAQECEGYPPGYSFTGTAADLAQYVQRHRTDIVYITLPLDEAGLADLVAELQDTTACVYFVPNILMFNLMQARTQEVGGVPVIAIWETPFSGLQNDLKRVVDIVCATVALILFAPLMVSVAVAVKLSSPGPILFKQRRYGLNGQEILIYKFRSMTVMEDGDVVRQATRNDQRITKVGAFLRRTSLDELPQFINVLQGRMSIVGPRPHAIAHNELYRKLIDGYMLRHKVKPGITGWAQIHGFRGETDTLDKMKKRVDYDLEYFTNWSLALDLQIIFRTLFVFFKSNNAY
jgi:putative colanic acid biosysnthesis UDP-glucose lipid carrier transferase